MLTLPFDIENDFLLRAFIAVEVPSNGLILGKSMQGQKCNNLQKQKHCVKALHKTIDARLSRLPFGAMHSLFDPTGATSVPQRMSCLSLGDGRVSHDKIFRV